MDKLHITRQEYIREDNQRERHEDQVRNPDHPLKQNDMSTLAHH